MKRPENIYIIVNESKDPGLRYADAVEEFLAGEGVHCFRGDNVEQSKIPQETDCILVLGGDGTVLQAARVSIGRDIPILGINLGTLGYLAEIEKGNWKEALSQLLSGNYEIEERMMIQGVMPDGSVDYALNDVVIGRTGALRILNYNVYVGGGFLNTFSADGIIISTPTGSTAYNLSAGGPIVEPSAQLVLMTPICPHTLNTRSIILSAEDKIEIEIGYPKQGEYIDAEANFDGNIGQKLRSGDRILIQRADRTTKLIKLSRRSFLETLHRKMSV